MAGFSLVILILLALWPIALLACVLYLTVETAALAVSSPAFVPLIISMVACVLGCLDAARVMWRRYRDQDESPLRVKSFGRTLVLFAVSLGALCVGAWQAGVALFGFSRGTRS